MTATPGAPERFRSGLRAGLGFGAAAFVVGISFGVVAEPVMGSVAPIVMSAVVFAGASQFGATAVLISGGDAATAIATGAMLNARFLPMGVAAQSAPAQREGGFDREVLLGGTLPQYPGWVLGTAVGVLFGGALGDPETLGLDAIFPAFFVGLLVAELSRPHAVAAVLIGGAIALALTPLLPPGLPVLLASTAALIGLRR